jgi:hypothetical protein
VAVTNQEMNPGMQLQVLQGGGAIPQVECRSDHEQWLMTIIAHYEQALAWSNGAYVLAETLDPNRNQRDRRHADWVQQFRDNCRIEIVADFEAWRRKYYEVYRNE